jgi:hypothetical protein
MASVQSRARDVENTSYAATRALAEARISAFRAKADESITLIRQNFKFVNGTYQDPGAATIENARRQLAAAAAAGFSGLEGDPLGAWETVHKNVIAKVNAGNSAAAQAIATGTGPGSSNAAFTRLDGPTETGLNSESATVARDLTSSSWLLLALALVTLAVGVGAAVGAWVGVGQRLAEYR